MENFESIHYYNDLKLCEQTLLMSVLVFVNELKINIKTTNINHWKISHFYVL